MDSCVAVGEVALDGILRGINGVLAMTITAKENGIENIFVPEDNAIEAAVVGEVTDKKVMNVTYDGQTIELFNQNKNPVFKL